MLEFSASHLQTTPRMEEQEIATPRIVMLLVTLVIPARVAHSESIFSNGFENPVNWFSCEIGAKDTDPKGQIQPLGFVRINRTWTQAFSATGAFKRPPQGPVALFPNSPGSPVAVPCRASSTSACIPDKGTYTVIPITLPPGMQVDLSWDTVQANPSYGYKLPRPADSMFIGISNCPGDFRAPDANSPIDVLQNGCRRIGGGATIIYTARGNGPSNEYVCKLLAGEQYYINIAPINPVDGITPGEHTCSTSAVNSAAGCDIQMRSTGSTFLRGTD